LPEIRLPSHPQKALPNRSIHPKTIFLSLHIPVIKNENGMLGFQPGLFISLLLSAPKIFLAVVDFVWIDNYTLILTPHSWWGCFAGSGWLLGRFGVGEAVVLVP